VGRHAHFLSEEKSIMNSQQFIYQIEREADRDDIVDLHGKDAYYTTISPLIGR
jgi:hypothetical protein